MTTDRQHVRAALVAAEAALDEALDNTGRDATSAYWLPLIKVRTALFACSGASVLVSGAGTQDDAHLVYAPYPKGGRDGSDWFVVLEAADVRDAKETVLDELPTYVKHPLRVWSLLGDFKARTLPGRFLLNYLVPVEPDAP